MPNGAFWLIIETIWGLSLVYCITNSTKYEPSIPLDFACSPFHPLHLHVHSSYSKNQGGKIPKHHTKAISYYHDLAISLDLDEALQIHYFRKNGCNYAQPTASHAQ